jgi:arylformamidase
MRIDLSHTIENGLVTYKGLPAPVICDYLSREESKKIYAEGTSFQIAKIEMVSNTGTYLDCPFHRYENGADLSELPLDRLADLEAITIRSPYTTRKDVDAEIFHQHDVEDKAVLIHTGWDAHWNTDQYYDNHPYLTAEAAEYLKSRNVLLVGIDSHNIDDTRGNFRPVHTILLGCGILIVEHLCNLSSVPDEGFLFTALPPKFKGVGTFPVRAFAKIN